MIMYMPQLIEAGRFYKALPPLYAIPRGKNSQYFTAMYDFVRYIQKDFTKSNNICDMKGNPIASKDLTIMFMTNQDYVYYLESIAQTLAVDPNLLELALFDYYNKTALPSMKKNLKSKYRFMNIDKINNTLEYRGTISEFNTLFVNEKMIDISKPILDSIEKNKYLYYKLNGEETSIYGIMSRFEQAQPKNLQRYKGLGEMDADEIAVSTLLPGSDRTLFRYTLEDAKEEIKTIRQYESDTTKLFKFVGKVTRQDLLD